MAINRRKINFNVWRDPQARTGQDLDYLSPHCQNAACSWCKERARRKRAAATAALEATMQPGMFWDRKIGGHQEQLGPSAPDAWKQTYVKPAPGPHVGDVLGYWPKK